VHDNGKHRPRVSASVISHSLELEQQNEKLKQVFLHIFSSVECFFVQ